MSNILGEIYQNFLRTGRYDNKGREIGYVVGLRDDGTNFYAWVQNTRRIDGEWEEFGAQQHSKCFASQSAATNWAYATAKQRIAKLAA
jgi:hypothetical protein